MLSETYIHLYRKVSNSQKIKSVKNVIIKKVSYENFSSKYKYSTRKLYFET